MNRPRITSVEQLTHWRDELRTRRACWQQNGGREVRICTGAGCIASGSLRTKEALEQNLEEMGLREQWRIVGTGCMGPCFGGPVLMVEDIVYEHVRPEDTAQLVREHFLQGKIVERLTHRRPDGRHVARIGEIDFFKRQVKIVLRNCGEIDPTRIEDYIERDGYQALAKVLQQRNPDWVIETLRQSGLRGRGGAGFPTWRKWDAARRQADPIKYVVCNADEGDPGAFMDRSVLEGDPHSVIEGM
ncbi:MAG: NAD(P)H-dependent oxidoreductase subunit E, partial [Thermogutta sp.]